MTLHLIKLSVGTTSVEDLEDWHKDPRAQGPDGLPRHVTRMWPKREAELLDGGSIYWVFQGIVQCRQPILRLDEVTGSDGIRRCAIVLAPGLIRTATAQKRPFQGWRYLSDADKPPDRDTDAADGGMPPEMEAELRSLGLI